MHAENDAAAEALPAQPTDEIDILVIDDDQGILDAVSCTLELHGYRVATAGDGAEGLRIYAKAPPRLVLLDMRMPVVDGWEFSRAVRELGGPVNIVIMTATTDIRRWAGEVGAVGYLAKPFDLHELINTVQRTLLSA